MFKNSNNNNQSNNTQQVTLYKHLLKKGFNQQKVSTHPEEGRSKPEWFFFRSKNNPDLDKKMLQKESSATEILISRIILGESDIDINVTIVMLLDQGLGEYRGKYTPQKLFNAYKGVIDNMDAKSQAFIAKATPAIRNCVAYPYIRPRRAELRAVFKEIIQKERAYSAISALFVRILVGPIAPKIKFLNDTESPYHLKLLSSYVVGSKSFFDVIQEDKMEELIQCAPEVAASALLCDLIGRERMEMKLDNFLHVKQVDGSTIVPIDTDFCFDTSCHDHIKALTLDIQGAKSFHPDRSDNDMQEDAHKFYWDKIFSKTNDKAIKDAMVIMLERTVSVLSDELINYVIDYVIEQDEKMFELTPEDRDYAVNFMQKAKEVAQFKLRQAGLSAEPKDLTSTAPWLNEMMESVASKAYKI